MRVLQDRLGVVGRKGVAVRPGRVRHVDVSTLETAPAEVRRPAGPRAAGTKLTSSHSAWPTSPTVRSPVRRSNETATGCAGHTTRSRPALRSARRRDCRSGWCRTRRSGRVAGRCAEACRATSRGSDRCDRHPAAAVARCDVEVAVRPELELTAIVVPDGVRDRQHDPSRRFRHIGIRGAAVLRDRQLARRVLRRVIDVEAPARRVVRREGHREETALATREHERRDVEEVGVESVPARTSLIPPPCSTTKTRSPSPGGAAT